MDVLQQLTQEDIVNLLNFYKNYQYTAPQIVNFLKCVLKWSSTNYIKVFSPFQESNSDGTFIAVLEFDCYEIYMYTMEKSCKKLSNALKQTKMIQWKNDAIIYALHGDLQPYVIEALTEINVPICFVQESPMWMKTTTELHPPIDMGSFYLGSLNSNHSKTINDLWPYRYTGSEGYVRTIIEFNGGIGVFRKNTKESEDPDELVAWVLKNGIGMMGLLQTKNKYQRLGLGTWVVSAMSHKMAAEGMTQMCTIAVDNKASQKTFTRYGFKQFANSSYIGIGTEHSIAFDCQYDCGLSSSTK